MPEVTLTVGGRDYRVSCRQGEEEQLQQAAALLDSEAQALNEALGRVPEPRMLLMSGLMLADRTAELALRAQAQEEEIRELRTRVQEAEKRAGAARDDSAALAQARARADKAVAALDAATKRAESLAAE